VNNKQVNNDTNPVRIQEIDVQQNDLSETDSLEENQQADQNAEKNEFEVGQTDNYIFALLAFALLLMLIGFVRARRL
jgi:hypothetical protein